MSILASQHCLPGLRLLFRLDRLVSGLCVLASSAAAARSVLAAAEAGCVSKVYCARVAGRLCAGSAASALRSRGGAWASGLQAQALGSWEAALQLWQLHRGGEGSSHAPQLYACAGADWSAEQLLQAAAAAAAGSSSTGSTGDCSALLPPVLLTLSLPIQLQPGKRGRFMAAEPGQGSQGPNSGINPGSVRVTVTAGRKNGPDPDFFKACPGESPWQP